MAPQALLRPPPRAQPASSMAKATKARAGPDGAGPWPGPVTLGKVALATAPWPKPLEGSLTLATL